MWDLMKFVAGLVLVLAVIVGLGYGGWRAYRYVNWHWGYQDQVEAMIDSKVKPECLVVSE